MTTSPTHKQDEIDETDLFYFESDHLALRGNKDYSDMLKTMFVLEAQRQTAIEDFNKVVEIKKECLANPLACIEKLKSGNLGIPDMQQIIEIPKINWSKYNVKIPNEFMKEVNCDQQKDYKHDVNTHRSSHSTPWTTEEQRRLEELLIKYPSEEVEAQRFKKIAKEMGTRTAKQVSSRIQKYYLKLLEAGLPVPGRIPKSKAYDRRLMNRRQKHKYAKPSTFFPHLDIPVTMNECEEVPGPSVSSNSGTISSNYLLANNYHEDKHADNKNEIDLQLELLRRIKKEKINDDTNNFHHIGFKCDYCESEPIEGTRWHCSTCASNSVDFCTDCMISQLYSENAHPAHHKFVVARNEKVIDSESESVTGSSLKNGGTSSGESDSEVEDAEEEEKCETVAEPEEEEEEETMFTTKSSFNIQVSECCPSNIFETKSGLYVNGVKRNFTDTQNVSYDYLHTNLLLDDS